MTEPICVCSGDPADPDYTRDRSCVVHATRNDEDFLLETIETARLVLDGELDSSGRIGTFAQAIVQLSDRCVNGLPCEKHGDAVHGREAEELRVGIEKLLAEHDGDYDELRTALQRLLDEVDARDSLGFLEAADTTCFACDGQGFLGPRNSGHEPGDDACGACKGTGKTVGGPL